MASVVKLLTFANYKYKLSFHIRHNSNPTYALLCIELMNYFLLMVNSNIGPCNPSGFDFDFSMSLQVQSDDVIRLSTHGFLLTVNQ